MTIGQRVEAVRAGLPKSKRISRTQLAQRLGLDRSTVTKWATGHGSPRDLEKVAEVMDVSVAEIYAAKARRKQARA